MPTQVSSALAALAALAVACLLCGCNPTYAPILRGGTGAMPESSGGAGNGSAQIGFGWPWTFATEPRIKFGLSPRVDLELNVLWLQGPLAIPSSSLDLIFSTGVQVQIVRHRWFRLALRGGGGVGRGGLWSRDEDPSVDSDWKTYDGGFAGGGYGGVDLGFRVHRKVGLYLGNTFHASVSADSHIPVTAWGYHSWGIELDWTPRFFSTFENGFFWYANSTEYAYGTSIFYLTLIGYRWGPKAARWR